MKKLYVYLSLNGEDKLVGTLSSDFVRGEETFSFEFSDEFLLNKKRPLIDPLLSYFKGKQYSFGFINDMTPDRFGMLLMNKNEQIEALKENRVPKKLTTSDYLIRVNDLSRMGALRIKEDKNGPFINEDENAIPPYIYLRDIEYASLMVEENKKFDEAIYKRLLSPGSSLGGARPKANFYMNDEVYLAKFPSKHDEYDVELWEYLIYQIAKELGLNVSDYKLEKYSNYGHTLLIKRFDRNKNNRVHYLSGVTALGAVDGDSNQYSYLDLANFITSYCVEVKRNLEELYKRMVFSYFINNTDNHLRNHAFIYVENELELSPMFDVNPTFFDAEFELSFGFGNNKKGLKEVAKYFYISDEEAENILISFKQKIAKMIEAFANKYPKEKQNATVLLSILDKK